MKVFISIILISLFSTLVSGYQFGVSDQEIFIPYIYKIQDPGLFAGDKLFSQFTANASVFYQIMAYMTKYCPQETIFFLGFLILKTILFVGIYLLSKEIFKKKEIAYLSLLPFLIPKFVGGTANFTYDDFFGYRSVGIVFLVYFLLLILKNKFVKSSLLAGIGLFFHPLSIIPILPVSPILILKNSRHRLKDLILLSVIILTFGIGYQLIFGARVSVFQQSPEWLSIIMSRNDYIFASTWSIFGWLSLGLYLALTAFCLLLGKLEQKKNILTITVVCLFLFFVNYLFLDVFKLAGIAKFQLVRSIFPIAIMALILSPALLMFKSKTLKFLGFASFAFLSLNLFYLFLFSFLLQCTALLATNKRRQSAVNGSSKKVLLLVLVVMTVFSLLHGNDKILYPAPNSPWRDVQMWAKNNTAKDSMFLVPFYSTGFRIYSKRPIIGDIKDGAVVVYDRKYATYWNNLKAKLKNYDRLSEKEFTDLKTIYNFDYIVTAVPQNLKFKKIYENEKYTIYKPNL